MNHAQNSRLPQNSVDRPVLGPEEPSLAES